MKHRNYSAGLRIYRADPAQTVYEAMRRMNQDAPAVHLLRTCQTDATSFPHMRDGISEQETAYNEYNAAAGFFAESRRSGCASAPDYYIQRSAKTQAAGNYSLQGKG